MGSEARRREWCAELFRTYDVDRSGSITAGEFLNILKVLDDTLKAEDVERTFHAVGAGNELDEEHLWLWCANVFGDFSDDEFSEQLQELIDASRRPEKFDPARRDPETTTSPKQAVAHASDLGWLIDAAQHELALLEAVAKGEPQQDGFGQSPLRQQVGSAQHEIRTRPAVPSDLQDQVMVRRARAMELELAEMASGERELDRAQAALADLGLAELDAAAHQEASARLEVRCGEVLRYLHRLKQELARLTQIIPSGLTPPTGSPQPVTCALPEILPSCADPEKTILELAQMLSEAVQTVEGVSHRASEYVKQAQTKLQLDRIHPIALAPSNSAESTTKLRENIQALLNQSVEGAPEQREEEQRGGVDVVSTASELRRQIQAVLLESAQRHGGDASDARSDLDSRISELERKRDGHQGSSATRSTRVEGNSSTESERGLSEEARPASKQQDADSRTDLRHIEMRQIELRHKAEVESLRHDNAKLEQTAADLKEQLADARRMHLELLETSHPDQAQEAQYSHPVAAPVAAPVPTQEPASQDSQEDLALEASVQATRVILLSMSRMVQRHSQANLVRMLMVWQQITAQSKLAASFYNRTEGRVQSLETTAKEKVERSTRMARAWIFVQFIKQIWATKLTYAFATWRAVHAMRGSGSEKPGITFLAVLRASIEVSGPAVLQALADAEIHALVRTLKSERDAAKSSGAKSHQDLTTIAAAVFAEANRRIGFAQLPDPDLANSNSAKPLRLTQFEVCQDEVEMALSLYNQQRLSHETDRLEHQHMRVAQAEATVNVGLLGSGLSGGLASGSEHCLLHKPRMASSREVRIGNL